MLIDVFSGPPAPAKSRAASGDSTAFALDTRQIFAIAAVVVYALLIGTLILTGTIAPSGAYVWLALPCLVPAAWYGFGFLNADGRDFGLVFLAAGWFFAALTFFLKHFSSMAAFASGTLSQNGTDSPLSYGCAILAAAGIVGGAILSSRNWAESSQK